MSQLIGSASQSRPTYTVENYLMIMYVMERDQGEIVAARLAEMLNVAPATVTMTLKRMERDNWIGGRGRKNMHLTETGRAAAHSVIRRHMLTEWLLVRILKVPLCETHDEAHNIEHAISPRLEKHMRDILGDPQVCPHGNPFPGCEAVTREWVPLTDLPPGEQVVIRRIHEFAEENEEMLEFLCSNGIRPGVRVQIVDLLPFNQTLSLRLEDDRMVTLGFSTAQYLYAEQPG